ncbi:adenylosuccinate synthase [Spirochaeta thermophila]|uniref:Adenylosuccinate synthetase n=1 Tax=Winmispira thermophila (strain ATCC 49972 / DSM 6192 / RI 19.B1) TaxID=665571 RepID=E0RSG1_WINT6|nr:adenylosuccinate synthase [Spirochaeta thermophila]ADN01948.1 adenylosuccinate synthetase [Spirochaeta thermophila DSM 6192]
MNIVVVGAQWGDEGKGKIVDVLASRADLVVRYSGGANAGHTIVHDGVSYKLHLVPSGIVYPNTEVVLGTGMVIDPEALFLELSQIEALGVDWKGRLYISDRAHLVFPSYKAEDKAADEKRRYPIGTTGRGIGVAYAKKAFRDGVRMIDLFDDKFFSRLTPQEKRFVEPYLSRLEPLLVNLVSFMRGRASGNILFEGAQGILLDLDVGTYPYVSSGVSAPAGASLGGGVGPCDLDAVYGVCKAYTTRVGYGPFPSEFRDHEAGLGDRIREIGHEYGTTTGRPRRCGYLDLVALKYACEAGGLSALHLTHLDVYDTFDEIGVCVAYRIGGDVITEFPSSISALEDAEPVIRTVKGWKRSLRECRSYDDLPSEARAYVDLIEEYTSTPVEIVSVGCEREETIIRKDPWKRS